MRAPDNAGRRREDIDGFYATNYGLGMTDLTVIDEQIPRTVAMAPDGSIDPGPFGWERKPEGLCRGDVCIPLANAPLTLEEFARATRRPLVIDETHRVAALGASAADRSAELRSGFAPDFALPDVKGVLHRLSDFRGRKVVLYAYGSW